MTSITMMIMQWNIVVSFSHATWKSLVTWLRSIHIAFILILIFPQHKMSNFLYGSQWELFAIQANILLQYTLLTSRYEPAASV